MLKTISEVLTVINAMLDCKIDLMGFDSEKFINREQEYLEYCRKKLVKFSLYILKEYDMLHILEIEDFLKSDLDKLLVDLNLKRKGQEGYLEQQALLVDLKDIELAQYIKNKSPEEFSNEPLTNYLSRDEWWCKMLCELNKNLQEIEMDENFWYNIFIDGKGFTSVMRHNEKLIKAILQKNQEEIFNILGDDAHLKNIINSIRTLGNKSDITDEEFQIIKSSLTDKLLANLPLKLFINNYSFATTQIFIDRGFYLPLGLSDLIERDSHFEDVQDTPVNYFNFACAFIILCMRVEISNDLNYDINDFFEKLDKEYIEDIIEKNGLREVLNNLRTVNGEPKLTDDEYQHIVCDVYDTFIDTFSISEGINK